MGSKWERIKIEQLQGNQKGAIAIGPFGSRMKSDCYVPYGIPVVRGTNISSGPDFKGEFVYISPELADTLGSCNVYKNDLIFPHRGSIGEVGIINDNNRYVLSSSMMKLTCDCKKVKPMFLYYFFKSQKGRNELLKNASQVGTPGIAQPLSSLKQIEIELPSLSIQNKIIEIIESLDKKISLNNNLNQILEQMSQTLFKSWFVDFDPVIDNALDAGNPIPEALQSRAELRQKVRNSADFKPLPADIRALFPAEFEETEMGWVPKKWKNGNLSDVTKILSGFAFKSKDFGDNGKGVIKIKNITTAKTIDIGDTQKISEFIAKDANRFLLLDGDILMAMTGATVGKFGVLTTKNNEEYYLNQRVAKFETENKAYLYCVLNQESTDRFITNAAQGSAQPNISAKDILSTPLLIPSVELINTFNDFISHLFYRMIANTKANLNLTALRDTLLPKLISGELSLEDLPDLANQTEPT